MMFGLLIKKFQIALILGGLGGFILSAGLGFGGLDFIIKTAVRRMMRLVPDSKLWEIWKNIPVDIYLQVYMFNITNAENLNQGEKPVLKELGPYVYFFKYNGALKLPYNLMLQETQKAMSVKTELKKYFSEKNCKIKLNKVDITVNETEDVVRYRQLKTYYFVPEKSVGPDSDQVTFINIMFMITAHEIVKKSDLEVVHEAVDNMLSEKGEKLYVSSSVREFLFDGVSIRAYVEMMEDPMVKMSGDDTSLPEEYADGKFALFKGKNGTDEGIWEVHTGITRSEDFGRVVSVNGQREQTVWKGEACNALNGTDAQLYQPFVEPGVTILQGFIPALCRSIMWNYVGPVEAEGIQCARFHLADFLTPAENPAYSCFCPYENQELCNITGLAYLKPCVGAPLIVSKPHFYNVDESVLQMVEGLSPNKENHEARIDMHTFTGSTVKAAVRLQFSVELPNYPGMPSFKNAARAIVPFMWMEQGATLGGANRAKLLFLEMKNKLWPIIKYLWMLLSLAVVGLGVFLLLRNRQGNAVTQLIDQKTVGELEKEFVFVFSKNALAMKGS